MIRRLLLTIATVTLPVVAVGCGLLLCEVAARVLGGRPLAALRLPPPMYVPAPPRRFAAEVARAPLPADVEPSWIDVPPPPLGNRRAVDPELVERWRAAESLGVKSFEAFRVWNRRVVEREGCRPGSLLQRLPPPLLVFDPPEDTELPPYRYLPSSTLPMGLVTNRFGWRGPELPLDKPAGTIRLAFVGASTTVGLFMLPFSYPEYVVHWLNLWAETHRPGIRFDGINAGREGLSSGAIAAVVRQEVLPAEPDLVVYYEGANQSLCRRSAQHAPAPAGRARVLALVDRIVAAADGRSELALRVHAAVRSLQARGGYEPPKPPAPALWSPDLDEDDPSIHDASLPAEMKTILADLEAARAPLAAAGSELAMSSFVWLVSDGLRLDPRRHTPIYRALNEGCWPYRYADVRRWVNLHNRLMERYAARKGLVFLDVARDFPPDPELFFDSVHLRADGTRLHAWLVFRALLPVVRSRIDAGAWPRADRVALRDHPAIAPGRPYTPSCGE